MSRVQDVNEMSKTEDATSIPNVGQKLPRPGQLLVVEINHALVDCTVVAYKKGKQVAEAPYTSADQVRLSLHGLPIGDKLIDTETTMKLAAFRDMLRQSKESEKERETEASIENQSTASEAQTTA